MGAHARAARHKALTRPVARLGRGVEATDLI
jgi:hypothetical protein